MRDSQSPQFRLSVCGIDEIDKFAGNNVTHLISIDDPGAPTETPEWFRGIHWHLVFQDVETVKQAKQFRALGPTIHDVKQIIEFGETCLTASKTKRVHLLIHCMAGVSRSTAAAFAILCMIHGKGSEPESLEHLLAIRPDALPNRLVVKYADQLLGRDGKMLEALRHLRERWTKRWINWAQAMKKQTERPNKGIEHTR